MFHLTEETEKTEKAYSVFSVSFCRTSSCRLAQRTLAKLAKILQSKQSGIVSVVPDNLIGVIADRSDLHRRQARLWGQLARGENSKGIGRLTEFSLAAGAGAVVSKMLPGVNAPVPVAPINGQLILTLLAQCQRPRGLRR